MQGQWIVAFTGTNNGLAVLDVDDAGTHFEGHAFAFDSDPSIPSILFDVITPDKNAKQTLVTRNNLDDIEGYIDLMENRNGKRYLQVIDLPFAERREIMEHLSLMGITAGTLFPDLVGACEELRGRFFHPFT